MLELVDKRHDFLLEVSDDLECASFEHLVVGVELGLTRRRLEHLDVGVHLLVSLPRL